MNNIERLNTEYQNAEIKHVNLAEIVIDAGTQQRDKLDAHAVDNYAHAMAEGKANEFPPIKLMELTEPVSMPDGSILEIGTLVLVDGFHRVDSAHTAKLGTFQALTVAGTLQDAIYFSMGTNAQNGVNFKGKDYQIAIKRLYTMEDGKWRAHGMKKEIAELLGCSTKTVERAVSAIDKASKAEAFKLFEQGTDLQTVADTCYKSLKTIKQWFEEWTKAQDEKGPEGSEGSEGTNQEDQQNAGDKNPLDLTFAEVLALKDSDLKAKFLKLLMDSIEADKPQDEPQPEPQPEPQAAPEGSEGDTMTDLANQWRGQDWWIIMGLDLAALNKLAKPSAAVKRAYNKMLKKCHSDKYGENEALEILKDALAASKKMFK